MNKRGVDGSAGDADYGAIGGGYSDHRRPDERIAARINEALGLSRTVVNVGAGAGSYEAADLAVTAVEPSASMRAQRPAHLPAAVDAVAEDLPFGDDTFDAAMATFSIHQWSDFEAGLREMRRVARGPVVVLTCDPDLVREFWLYEYAPAVLDTEARRYPSIETIARTLDGEVLVRPVPIPADCTDGFNEAYYARPERLLDPGPGRPVRPGASSTPMSANGTPKRSGAISTRAPGTGATARSADSPSCWGRWYSSGRSRRSGRSGRSGRGRRGAGPGCREGGPAVPPLVPDIRLPRSARPVFMAEDMAADDKGGVHRMGTTRLEPIS